MKQIRFTKLGYEKLKNEQQNLIEERKLAVIDLQKARAMGDLSENGYYKASKAKLGSIDSRLRRYSNILEQAIVIESTNSSQVGIGSTVELSDGNVAKKFIIVGDLEADPIASKISLLSPLGKAVSGKKKGDTVVVQSPTGSKKYTITKVSV